VIRTADAVPAIVAAAGIATAAALPFFRLRPNRIAQGEAVYLANKAPLALALIAIAWLLFAVAAVGRARLSSVAAAAAPVVAVATSLVATAFVGRVLVGANAIARLTLGPGFWLCCVLSYVAYVVVSRGRSMGRVPGAVGALCIVGLAAFLFSTGAFASVAIVREWSAQKAVFATELGRHMALSGFALLGGGILGGAFGAAASRHKALRESGFIVLNALQTIPSLALFGFLILPLSALAQHFPLLREWGIGGIGPAPALIALTLYAAFPIARNTCAALEGVPAAALDAGKGMGMGKLRLFFKVELPLALPVALAGFRTAAVQSIGNTAVAALIGAGGLGVFIFQGLGQFAMDMVLLGTLPLIALALAVDAVFGLAIRLATPRALRRDAVW
jgi:osmoprotectant transport system permease protein